MLRNRHHIPSRDALRANDSSGRRFRPLDHQMGDEQRHNFAPGEQQFR